MSYLNLTRFRYHFENLIKCNLAVKVKRSVEQAFYSHEKQLRRRSFISSEKGLQGADIFGLNIIRWIKS